jgi:hypothetical protein
VDRDSLASVLVNVSDCMPDLSEVEFNPIIGRTGAADALVE